MPGTTQLCRHPPRKTLLKIPIETSRPRARISRRRPTRRATWPDSHQQTPALSRGAEHTAAHLARDATKTRHKPSRWLTEDDLIRDAGPAEKAAIYDQLGLKVTFEPDKAKLRAEATISPERALRIWQPMPRWPTHLRLDLERPPTAELGSVR